VFATARVDDGVQSERHDRPHQCCKSAAFRTFLARPFVDGEPTSEVFTAVFEAKNIFQFATNAFSSAGRLTLTRRLALAFFTPGVCAGQRPRGPANAARARSSAATMFAATKFGDSDVRWITSRIYAQARGIS
jgi:hypothetical protein